MLTKLTIRNFKQFENAEIELGNEKLGLPNLMLKTNYHELARFMPKDRIPAEVAEVLDAIQAVAERAAPLAGD